MLTSLLSHFTSALKGPFPSASPCLARSGHHPHVTPPPCILPSPATAPGGLPQQGQCGDCLAQEPGGSGSPQRCCLASSRFYQDLLQLQGLTLPSLLRQALQAWARGESGVRQLSDLLTSAATPHVASAAVTEGFNMSSLSLKRKAGVGASSCSCGCRQSVLGGCRGAEGRLRLLPGRCYCSGLRLPSPLAHCFGATATRTRAHTRALSICPRPPPCPPSAPSQAPSPEQLSLLYVPFSTLSQLELGPNPF